MLEGRHMTMIRPLLVALTFCQALVTPLQAFGLFDNTGLTRGSRWDANPRTMQGVERSLSGGLRFSLQGGSYAAFRSLLSWQGTPPSDSALEQAVLDAFAVWTAIDPATGLGTTLRFVPDLATPVSATVTSNVRLGAEIDILASTDTGRWDPGNSSTQAEAIFNSTSVSGNLRLTSGTTGYAGFAISGADITFNNNTGALYTLSSFRTILAHEIGHALGLADVDITSGPGGTFIDDNYTPANALATLTNSFALSINHLNPAASPLTLYTVSNGVPGIDTTGVNILMESSIPSVFFSTGAKLSNDDIAARQFMYPVAPPAAPVLSISQAGTQLVLTWNQVPAWLLETSPTMATGTWTRSTLPETLTGNIREARLTPAANTKSFFRLRRSP